MILEEAKRVQEKKKRQITTKKLGKVSDSELNVMHDLMSKSKVVV